VIGPQVADTVSDWSAGGWYSQWLVLRWLIQSVIGPQVAETTGTVVSYQLKSS